MRFMNEFNDLSLFTITNVLLELHKESGGKTGLTMRHESFSNLLLCITVGIIVQSYLFHENWVTPNHVLKITRVASLGIMTYVF